MLAAPTNILAAHIGNGVILLSWSPVVGADHYELWASTNISGPYHIFNTSILGADRGHAYNLPIGCIAYFQLRAIDASGTPGSFGQAILGTVSKPTAQFLVSAISGSKINKSAVFTVMDSVGRLIGIEAAEDINIEDTTYYLTKDGYSHYLTKDSSGFYQQK